MDPRAIQPPLQRLVLNLKLGSSQGRKCLNLTTTGQIHAITVSPSLKQRHDPASFEPIKNLASAPQQGRQRGFRLGGSSAGTAPDPPVLQASNLSAAPAGQDGAGSGGHSMDHLATDQCGGCRPRHFATKSADNYSLHAAAAITDGRRLPVFCIDRLPLRCNL